MIAPRPGQHFTWHEVTRSTAATRLGLDNTPDPTEQWCAIQLCKYVLDPLRTHLGRPIGPTSWFRAPKVNEAVRGASNSLHMRGLAVDFKVPGLTAPELAREVMTAGVPYDQIVWYAPSRGGHVHLHIRPGKNRGMVLHAPSSGGYANTAP